MIEYKIRYITDQKNKVKIGLRIYEMRLPIIDKTKLSPIRGEYTDIDFTIDHYPVAKQEIEDKITDIINITKNNGDRLEQSFPKY